MTTKPSVTCLMITCGRTGCIGESVFSFLAQTYPAKKLIILDTHPQTIQFNKKLPESVSYIKTNTNLYNTIGAKYYHAMSMVDTQFFCWWDDDDIWLPSHLENLVSTYQQAAINPGARYKIGHPKHFTMYGGVDKPIHIFKLDSNLCICRYIFETKKLDSITLPEPSDVFLLNSFETIYQKESPAYIYRWDTGQAHVSGLYGTRPYEELFRTFEDRSCSVDISKILVDISWRHDYEALCANLTHGIIDFP